MYLTHSSCRWRALIEHLVVVQPPLDGAMDIFHFPAGGCQPAESLLECETWPLGQVSVLIKSISEILGGAGQAQTCS